MLAFFMWAFGVAFNSPLKTEIKPQIKFQQHNHSSDLSHFHTVEVEESEFIIVESEPEFEIELEWFSIPTKTFNALNKTLNEHSNSSIALLFSSKETIPLYDLYCNWKFHLS